MIIDFIQFNTHPMSDNTNNEYIIRISDVFFNSSNNQLTLICKLTNEETSECFLMMETVYVGSKKYRKIMRSIYTGDDGDIVAVDTD